MTLPQDKLFLASGATLFVVSRLLAYVAGAQFDLEPLQYFWQYLDPKWLSNELWQSLYYQHSQPPLFNLFIGLVLQFPETWWQWLFASSFYLCSLFIYLSLYSLLRSIGASALFAFGIASIFILSPEALLYENMLFYTWPVAALLLAMATCLALYAQSKTARWLVLFFVLLTLLCLTRSMFHLIFALACVIGLWLLTTGHRAQVIGSGLISLLLIGAFYGKNLQEFGFFGSSSWTGMNLWRIVNAFDSQVTPSGPALAKIPPFSPLEDYDPSYQQVTSDFQSRPQLSLAYKPNGEVNYNHLGYIALSADYMEMSKQFIVADPVQYVKHIVRAWVNYTEPSWSYRYLRENSERIQPYIQLVGFHHLLNFIEQDLLSIRQQLVFDKPLLSCVPNLLGVLLLLGGGFLLLVKDIPALVNGKQLPPNRLLFYFILLTIGYTAVLGNSVEFGENNRFRVQTDPLLIVGLVCLWLSLRQWLAQPRH